MIKRLLIASTLLLPTVCQAQLDFNFASLKSAHQTGDKVFTYTGGSLSIVHQDGSWILSPCGVVPYPSPTRVPPITAPPICPLGTTGFLARGDLDGDDIRDDGSFWSLAAAPIPAVITAPFHSVGLRVESAPPSLFIRPGILPVNDGSIVIWYNVLTADQLQYDITRYSYYQTFAATPSGRVEHDRTVTTGAYKFSIPWIGDPNGNIRQVIGLNKISMPEAYPGLTQSPLNWGFRFTNNTWNGSNQMQFDPRLFNDLTWEGTNDQSGNNVFPAVDVMRLWMLETPSANPFTLPPSVVDPNVVFPIAGGSILFRDPTVQSYRLPGLFFDVGDSARVYLRLTRNHPTGIASDDSVRVFTVDIVFIDTYEGFAQLNGTFPIGTPASEREPDFDFDGDGVSNLIEFALNTDPANPASNPTASGAIAPFINGDLECEVTVAKRPDIGTSLRYELEYSPDMVTWTTITVDDPDWEITEDATQIRVRSTAPAGACFIRAKITILQ